MNSGHISFITKGKINSTGIHQKMDKIAYQVMTKYANQELGAGQYFFPELRDVIYFEGYNGPDGLKVKKGSKKYDKHHLWEPKTGQGYLMEWIEHHYHSLVATLNNQDTIDSGFEASWLAHYLGDIVTPAHHYSKDLLYTEGKLANQKFGVKLKEQYRVTKNFTDHIIFESGIASSLVMKRFNHIEFSQEILKSLENIGVTATINNLALSIQDQGLYEQYLKKGWSPKLYQLIREQVVDQGIQLISAIWYFALLESRE
ncbi:hypothetical protein KA531_02470 [Candidatus Saccharibacteria bacterium]|nr:hypothetical protein [Candidatus Saccharibacteria bacterium]